MNNILLVELKVATANALSRTLAVTPDGIALGVAIVQNCLSVNGPYGGSLRVGPCAGERRDRSLQNINKQNTKRVH